MNMENTNMTTSEKLHLLLDGEAEGIDTAEVLNEVSNNPELTQEFIDLVKMKKMMSGLTEAPPEHLRRTVLAGIGLGGSGLWYYLQNSSVVAATAAFVTSKLGAALVAGMVGAIATFMVMDNSGNTNERIANKQITSNLIYEELATSMPITMEVPVVTSFSVNQKTTSNESINQSTKINYIAANSASNNSDQSEVRSSSDENNYFEITQSDTYSSREVDNKFISSENKYYPTEQNTINISSNNEKLSGFIINPSNRILTNESEQQMLFSLQGRGISNSSLQTAEISTTEAPAINDIGIALMYSVTDEFEMGLEFGQEFFVKKINSNSFSNEETMLENQLTFWGGVRATYKFNNLEFIGGFKPVASMLVGGTNRGWVSKTSVGLIYDISNKLAVFGGPEWTSGFYQFDSQFLSTHKWGFQYGLALKF